MSISTKGVWNKTQGIADELIDDGTTPIDGDKIEISWTGAANYTAAATPAEADSADDLTAHLYGIDQALGTAGGAHASDHTDGTDNIDGDHLDVTFTPSNYTPATTPAEAADVDDLAAHLYGIDQALAASGGVGAGFFGDGYDGDATISTGTNATSSMYYNNLTIDGTGDLTMQNYMLFVAGTLTVQSGGFLGDRGGDASGTTGGGGGGSTVKRQAIGGESGVSGVASPADGNNGVHAGTGSTTYIEGGAGGDGGDAGVNTGGTGGTSSPNGAENLGLGYDPWKQGVLIDNAGSNMHMPAGGASGGSGAVVTSGTSGGSGGGGGVTIIYAKTVVVDSGGTISCKGGNGAAASAGDAGGGGGGGGGVLVIVTNSYTNNGTVTANGGTGGAGSGTGSAGVDGSDGKLIVLQV